MYYIKKKTINLKFSKGNLQLNLIITIHLKKYIFQSEYFFSNPKIFQSIQIYNTKPNYWSKKITH